MNTFDSLVKNAKKYNSTASSSPSTTTDYSIAAPDNPDNQALVDQLGGSIRSRNDATAGSNIQSFARSTGGDTSSPLFQFLASNAKTGASGQTGSAIADLRFKAAEAGANRELQRKMYNQQAALAAQRMANEMSLGTSELSLRQDNNDMARLGLQLGAITNNKWGGGLESQAAQTALGLVGVKPAASPYSYQTNAVTNAALNRRY